MNGWITAGVTGEPERLARLSQMGIDEEEVIPGIGQVLLDPSTQTGAGRGGPRIPRSSRTVGALRQPAADRGASKEPSMLRGAHRKLESNALVTREERKESVGRRRPDDLE